MYSRARKEDGTNVTDFGYPVSTQGDAYSRRLCAGRLARTLPQGHVIAYRSSLSLSAVAKHAFRQVRGEGGLFAELLRQLLPSLHNAPRRGRRRSLPDVGFGARSQKPVGDSRLGGGDIHQDGPGHQGQFGQPLTTLGAKTNWRAAPNICLAVKGSPSTGQRSR